jgi:hypothetical protein
MSVSYGGSSITFEDGSIVSSGSQGFKNKIINGAMMIDQRNSGASVTPTSNVFGPDRWTPQISQASKFSYRQMESANTSVSNYESSSAPTGFTNSLKITSSSAYTPVTGDYMLIRQHIEGYNIADLDWGSASAKTVTVSFWVKSSLVGSHSFSVFNHDGSRSYPVLYTINVANTWEYKTIVIPGDTSGTWKRDTSIGISIAFSIGSGATYSGPSGAWAGAWYPAATGAVPLIGTSGATLYITGVQFEKGTAASSFEFRSYTKELMLCQRYYWQIYLGGNQTQYYSIQGYVSGAAQAIWKINAPVPMRTAPALSISPTYNTGSGWQVNVTAITNSALSSAPSVINYDGNTNLAIYCPIATISSSYYCLVCIPYCPTGTNNYMYFSSEF